VFVLGRDADLARATVGSPKLRSRRFDRIACNRIAPKRLSVFDRKRTAQALQSDLPVPVLRALFAGAGPNAASKVFYHCSRLDLVAVLSPWSAGARKAPSAMLL